MGFGHRADTGFYDTVAPVILLFLYILSFIGFFFLGKTMLAATGSYVFNFVSFALGYALLLALVGWAYCSEYTILGLTNFLIACIGDAFNSKSIGDLFFDWSANAFVMAIPFICMFIGLTVQQIQANKAIGGSDEKATAGTDVEQSAEAAQPAVETAKPKGAYRSFAVFFLVMFAVFAATLILLLLVLACAGMYTIG